MPHLTQGVGEMVAVVVQQMIAVAAVVSAQFFYDHLHVVHREVGRTDFYRLSANTRSVMRGGEGRGGAGEEGRGGEENGSEGNMLRNH